MDLPNADEIAVFKNVWIPKSNHFKAKLKSDSVLRNEALLYSTNFAKYLGNYHGEISFWLKQEAIKRKVLQGP